MDRSSAADQVVSLLAMASTLMSPSNALSLMIHDHHHTRGRLEDEEQEAAEEWGVVGGT